MDSSVKENVKSKKKKSQAQNIKKIRDTMKGLNLRIIDIGAGEET